MRFSENLSKRKMDFDSGRFAGKVVLVTGSGRGIGLEIARAFAREGATLVLNDIGSDQLDEAMAEISVVSPMSISCVCDISKKEEVEKMVSTIISKLYRV